MEKIELLAALDPEKIKDTDRKIAKYCRFLLDDSIMDDNLIHQESSRSKFLKSHNRKLISIWKNYCGVQLFNGNHFNHKDLLATVTKTRRFFHNEDIKSMRNIGNCCWKVYSQGKPWGNLNPGDELKNVYHLRTPFLIKKTSC